MSRKATIWSAVLGCGAVIGAALWLASCQTQKRLVEVFDNGPVGGPAGSSEGFIWVGESDMPPPGKSWRPTDPAALTQEQKKRIR